VAGSVSAGSDSVAGNGDVTVPLLQCPELIALPSQQGSVFAVLKAYLRIGTWVAQWHQAMSLLIQPGLHRKYPVLNFHLIVFLFVFYQN